MTHSFEYTCPKCKAPGTSSKLKFGYYCPKCSINVPETIRRKSFERGVVAQTSRAIALIEGLIHPNRIETAARRIM